MIICKYEETTTSSIVIDDYNYKYLVSSIIFKSSSINVDGGFGEYFSEYCIIKVYITFITVMIFGGAINIKFCCLGPHCISIVKQVFEEKN